jgi:hypothetical protein
VALSLVLSFHWAVLVASKFVSVVPRNRSTVEGAIINSISSDCEQRRSNHKLTRKVGCVGRQSFPTSVNFHPRTKTIWVGHVLLRSTRSTHLIFVVLWTTITAIIATARSFCQDGTKRDIHKSQNNRFGGGGSDWWLRRALHRFVCSLHRHPCFSSFGGDSLDGDTDAHHKTSHFQAGTAPISSEWQ